MRKYYNKYLYIFIAMIFLLRMITIPVFADVQSMYVTTQTGEGWLYVDNYNAHWGNKIITYTCNPSYNQLTYNQRQNLNNAIATLSSYVSFSNQTQSTFDMSFNFSNNFLRNYNAYGKVIDKTYDEDEDFNIMHIRSATIAFDYDFMNTVDWAREMVIIHEICHALGLAHVEYKNFELNKWSLMIPSFGLTTADSYDLIPTDINGIKAVTESCTSTGHGSFIYTHESSGHTKKCGVCGAYTTNYTQVDPHVLGTTYTQISGNTTNHIHNCTLCSGGATESHSNFYYLPYSVVTHHKLCGKCNYDFSTMLSHVYDNGYEYYGNSQHYVYCACGNAILQDCTINWWGVCDYCNNMFSP